MSNFNEEKKDGLGHGFHKNIARLNAENEKNIETVRAWEQDTGDKPTREMMPEILTEEQLHEKAKEMTKQQAIEQEKLEQAGLLEQQQPQRRSFADKAQDALGSEAIEQAREDQRQAQEQARQNTQEQQRKI